MNFLVAARKEPSGLNFKMFEIRLSNWALSGSANLGGISGHMLSLAYAGRW